MTGIAVDRLADRGADAVQVVLLDGFSVAPGEAREPHRHDYHELIWVREGSGRPIARGASRSSSRRGGDHAGPETTRPVRVGDGAAADGLATGAAAPLPPEPEPDRSPSPPRPEIEDYLL